MTRSAPSPNCGIKSAGVKVQARYEFVTDTLVNLNASYTPYVGSPRIANRQSSWQRKPVYDWPWSQA